jgi:hypothetical protein
MATEDQDFSCYKGEAISQSWVCAGGGLTGKAITFTAKRRQTDASADAVLTKACTVDSDTHYTLTLTHAETNIAAYIYEYDTQMTTAGAEKPLALGTFEIKQEVLY